MRARSNKGVAGLEVWWKAREMVVCVYPLSFRFPAYESYALSAQLRRAATSVTLNIAEGYGRKYVGDYRRSVSHAIGSCTEVETALITAIDLGYVQEDDVAESMDHVDRVSRMLNGLFNSLKERPS